MTRVPLDNPLTATPLIGVVVVVRDEESYLGDCLESLAQQTVRDLEVVIVDDGSTDSSAEIAAGFTRRDARFRFIRQARGGVGRARNTGVAQLRAAFLAFVDGDEVVPRGALASLHRSLERTGSDFATGAVDTLEEPAVFDPLNRVAWHPTARRGTHIRDHPDLLADQSVTNKLWRRAFWEEHRLRFPEDVPHEDVQVSIPAHVMARQVDVVASPVSLRRPDDRLARSLGRRRTDEQALRDRYLAVDAVSRFLAGREEHELKRTFDQRCAADDLYQTMQALDVAKGGVASLFLDLANDFFDRADPTVFEPLPAIDRLKWHLVRRRLVPELLEVLKFDKTEEINRTPVVRRGRRHYGDYPFRNDRRLRIPREVYRLDQELALRARIDDVWWEGHRLYVEGVAHINLIDVPDARSGRIRLQLQRLHGGRRIELPVERLHRPDVTETSLGGLHNYDWSGFRTWVPIDVLRNRAGWTDAFWRLEVEVRGEGVTRKRWLHNTSPGRAQRPPHLNLKDVRVVPTYGNGRFAVVVDTMHARVRTAAVQQGVLQVEGSVRGRVDPEAARLYLGRESGAAQLEYPVAFSLSSGPLSPSNGRTPFVARVPLADLVDAVEVGDRAGHSEGHGDGIVWGLTLLPDAEANPTRLSAATDLVTEHWSVGGREVVLARTRRGDLDLVERDFRPEVRRASWTETGELELGGLFLAPPGPSYEVVLSALDRRAEHSWPLHRDGSEFRATLSPAASRTLAGRLPLQEGTWALLVRRAGEPDSQVRVKVHHELLGALPLGSKAGMKDLTLADVDYDSLVVEASRELPPANRGSFNQRRLQQVDFPSFLRLPVKDTVLFESYGASQFADSPKAIYEELRRRGSDLELLWSVADGQTELPEGLRAVAHRSGDWFEAMARSRYVVTCAYRPLEGWVADRTDQVVLQTWHGPPFKRIGFDSQRIEESYGRDYRERLLRETSSWDYLVSPNPVASPIMRAAFKFEGQLLETGAPRTDIFFRPDREAVAADVRRRLGLPEGRKVVLYAPTFRDDVMYQRGRRRRGFRLDMRLDLDRAREVLGADHTLLVRRHTQVIDNIDQADQGFARDVSLYPDVNELLLATDVLVTDYSSLMFDFANTGRPMVFFTYDLEDYRDRLRGFYFDVERLPGPLLRTSEDVIDAIRRAPAVREEHAATYADFVRDFCAYDDGKASARAVDAVFGS